MARGLTVLIILLLTAFVAELFGCGPARSFSATGSDGYNLITPATDTSDPDFTPISTGSTKEIKDTDSNQNEAVPYTPAGATDVFQKMQQELQPSSDKLLAKNVQSVDLALFDAENHQVILPPTPPNTDPSIAVTPPPPPVKIKFAVKFDPKSNVEPKELDFEADLTVANGAVTGHSAGTTNSLPGFFFTADVTCLELTCTNIELRVHKHLRDLSGSVSQSLADLGIFYRQTFPEVTVQRARDTDKYRDAGLESLQQLPKNVQATRDSVSVVDGPSYSRISVPDLNASGAQTKYALQLDTDLTGTQLLAGPINSVTVANTNGDVRGELVGNNPQSGNLTVDLNQPDTNEITRLHFIEPTDQHLTVPPPSQTVVNEKKNIVSTTRLIDVPADTPEVAQVSDQLAAHAGDSETQRLIQVLLGNERDRGTCRSHLDRQLLDALLKYGPPAIPYIQQIAAAEKVTPEIAYILPLESPFLTDPARPALKVGQPPRAKDPNKPPPPVTAIGPWMINDEAAETIHGLSHLAFNILPVVDGQANPDDDRTYFLNSTYMASIYLASFFKKFKNDAGFAILAYHTAGGGKADEIMNTLKVYTQFDMNLNDIIQNNMENKKNCDYITYAYAFLALRTVGQNLDSYGLSINTKNRMNKSRLKSPSGPLPSTIHM